MSTIGQRLREARERKGLSLKSISEEIKVRTDYLNHFEEDYFDFGLPEIYRRGFLELYAQYLKADVAAILEDYLALSQQSKKKAKREVYGQVELPAREEEALPHESKNASRPQGSRLMVLAGSSVLLVCTLLGGFFTWTAFFAKAPKPSALSQAPKVEEETIELLAKGDVLVIVKQDAEKIVKRKLLAGERMTFKKQGPITIKFSEGHNLQVIRGDKTYSMTSPGVGSFELS